LECAETLPQPEVFSLSELMQDVAQKFALAAADKQIALRCDPRRTLCSFAVTSR
jgi:hypothetical protein